MIVFVFDRIFILHRKKFYVPIITQNWKTIKAPDKILLIASSPKNESCFLGYTNSRGGLPASKFKNNSIVVLRGGRVYYNTDDIVRKKTNKKTKIRKKSTKKRY